MRLEPKFARLIRAVLAGVLAHMTAASAQTIDVPLGTPEGFSAVAVNAVGENRYCVSGNVFNDAGPSTSAMVVLVDSKSRSVLWKAAIPHLSDYVSNSAVACGTNGNAFYVVTQENANNAQSLNQTRVVINRVSASGKLEKQQVIEAGFDEWFYLLDIGSTGIAVAGGTSATVERGGPFGTFVARFDPELVPAKLTKLNSGAFWTDANARLDGQHLLVAGQFMPNPGAGRDAYAASKIDLDSGKYLWSAYSLPDNTRSARSYLSRDGDVYSAGLTPTDLSVATLDRQGKVFSDFSTKKPLCSLNAVALQGQNLEVIGTSCESDSQTVLLTIDLKTHTVGAGHLLDSRLSAVRFDGQGWVGIAKIKGRGPSLMLVPLTTIATPSADVRAESSTTLTTKEKQYEAAIVLTNAGKTTEGKKAIAYRVSLSSKSCHSVISGTATFFSKTDEGGDDSAFLPNGDTVKINTFKNSGADGRVELVIDVESQRPRYADFMLTGASAVPGSCVPADGVELLFYSADSYKPRAHDD